MSCSTIPSLVRIRVSPGRKGSVSTIRFLKPTLTMPFPSGQHLAHPDVQQLFLPGLQQVRYIEICGFVHGVIARHTGFHPRYGCSNSFFIVN